MPYPCPHCGNPNTHRHGDRRRKCPACGKTHTIDKRSDNGRPPDGDRAMSNAERQRKWREKKSDQTP